MRPAGKSGNIREQRRQQLQIDGTRAASMRDAFPDIAVLHIELEFDDHSVRPPSPQRHSLYPAARAFFRFACPCSDCDGEFDLGADATALASAAASKRRAPKAASGQVSCSGVRLRERAGGSPCHTVLHFRLNALAAPAA